MKRQTLQPAFTLIELLVVVAIITALIAILLPSLGRAVEVAHRAQCASNQRQLYLAAVNYAFDNDRAFQPTHRNGYTATNTDHISWISQEVYDYHLDRIDIDLQVFACPNRGVEFIKKNGSTYRLGYYFIYGRDDAIFNDLTYEPWDSPRSMTQPGDGVMFGDIIERGTFTPAQASVSHATTGAVYGPQFTSPEDLQSEGGNLGFTDGSVRWTAQSQMVERAASTEAAVRGYW